ncbi:stage II sporulation protein P [Alkalihalobacterium chitinilyticum]|uniref:Stage II sporulation protein P n=1 Tax=Alkalihalobacterium chitinilyticum TaxID=2980103 RepID=A0ABT5VEG7_9BACI|nr:stage II sporulation protein P [Alkalihalobacterium chitinilyticum]MDE5413857.1 stage II sporulation protein P [Alkalihalobacterium chitinilyticum]
MKRNRFHGLTISINRTSLRKMAVFIIVGIIAVFIFTGMLTSIDPGYGMASSTVHSWTTQVTGENLVYLMGMENRYFQQALPEESQPPNLSSIAFELATSINPDDPRSLLGRELPGFALFDGNIVVAGDKSDYTNMPIESAPPMEVLMAEREAATTSFDELDKPTDQAQPEMTTGERKVVHIIHSHTRESFLPELKGVTNPNEAWHAEVNISLVGERLGQSLRNRGIGTDVDSTDIQSILNQRDWGYPKSYDASRELVKEAMASNDQLEFFFDLHRDSLLRDNTTVTINGEHYARIYFVIGRDNRNREQNTKLAKDLHHRLEEKYPGLSRGVVEMGGIGRNGVYNQDLHGNSILIEFGGVENSVEENFRSADAFAEVFSEFYWEQAKVSTE